MISFLLSILSISTENSAMIPNTSASFPNGSYPGSKNPSKILFCMRAIFTDAITLFLNIRVLKSWMIGSNIVRAGELVELRSRFPIYDHYIEGVAGIRSHSLSTRCVFTLLVPS